MKNDNTDGARLRRALAIAFFVGALILIAVLAARCSEPSKVVEVTEEISFDDAAASTNAAATAQSALDSWAGEAVELVGVRWIDTSTAVATGKLDGGEHVAITVVRSADGWRAPWSPTATEAAPAAETETLPDVPDAAEGDERWETATGFLDAWLSGEDPWRWVAAGFRPEPPSVTYEWAVVGAGEPLAVPGAAIAVLPIDYEASTPGGASRLYRAWVAVSEDSDGQIGVTALAHRPPPQPTQ